MNEIEETKPQSGGCLRPFLGWIVLLLAVAAVLFFCIVKPHLEARGVDVDSKLAEWKTDAGKVAEQAVAGARKGAEAIKEKAPGMMEQAKEAFQNGKEKIADAKQEMPQMIERTQDTLQNGRKKAEDLAEKAQDHAETVQEEAAEWID